MPWPTGVEPITWPSLHPVQRHIANEALQAIDERVSPLVFAGPVGTGKSCLAMLVARLFPRAITWSTPGVLGAICRARTSDSGQVEIPGPDGSSWWSESQFYARFESAPLAVLDDLGTRELTEAQSDVLLELLNRRHGRGLIVTTNHNRNSLAESVGERIASRLLAGRQWWFEGADMRTRKAVPR